MHPGAVVYEDEHGVMYVNDDMSLTNSGGDDDEFAHEVSRIFQFHNISCLKIKYKPYNLSFAFKNLLSKLSPFLQNFS